MSDPGEKKGWFTTRKVLTYTSIALATAMVYTGKMSDGVWVYAMAVFIAGHHAADLIKTWKGN
jgi:hypothetical protein